MIRVVLLEDYLDQARQMTSVQRLAEKVDLNVFTTKASSEAETVERTRNANIVVTIRDRVIFTASLLTNLGHLQLLSVCGARLSHIDLETATKHGVLICAVSPEEDAAIIKDAKAATAEQTWGLILALVKDTNRNDRAIREGLWQTQPSRGLSGKTLGLLGLGVIGSQVAEMGRAMRMRVIAWSPHLTPERARESGVESVTFEQLFIESDIVSIHAPLLPENRNMVGEDELSLMGPRALLINIARAALVDEQAFRRALESGSIADAGLDVYWEEPLPIEHWLRRQENVVLAPHIGGFTDKGYESMIGPAIDNVVAFLDGKPKNLINPEVLERRSQPGGR
jgi:phosphoglycerate dehydrogenase-like enzyme